MGLANRKFTVILDPDPEGGYTVTVPALPGCITEGDTLDEALENAKEAIKGFLEALALRGESPPEKEATTAEVEVEV